jgi:hypothetical protein
LANIRKARTLNPLKYQHEAANVRLGNIHFQARRLNLSHEILGFLLRCSVNDPLKMGLILELHTVGGCEMLEI